jgi:hypothetical protein
LHGTFILAESEPAKLRDGILGEGSPPHFLHDPTSDQFSIRVSDLRFFFRGHVAEVKPIKNFLPLITVFALNKIYVQLVDLQIPLRLHNARVMAFGTMLFNERGNLSKWDRLRSIQRTTAHDAKDQQRTDFEMQTLHNDLHKNGSRQKHIYGISKGCSKRTKGVILEA